MAKPNNSEHLNYFSKKEKGFVQKLSQMRDKIFAPITHVLAKLHIGADILSYSSVLILVGFLLLIKSRPVLAFLFILANIILDAMDGVLARHTKTDSNSGAFTDIVCDHVSMFIVVTALLYYNFVMPLNVLVYIFLYVVLIVFTVVRNKLSISPKFVFRSKYYVFFLYGIWAFTDVNLLDGFIFFFNLIMFGMVLRSYAVLKRKLKEYG